MIKTVGLKKVYKTQAESVVALDDVNIAINDGELVTLAGSSRFQRLWKDDAAQSARDFGFDNGRGH